MAFSPIPQHTQPGQLLWPPPNSQAPVLPPASAPLHILFPLAHFLYPYLRYWVSRADTVSAHWVLGLWWRGPSLTPQLLSVCGSSLAAAWHLARLEVPGRGALTFQPKRDRSWWWIPTQVGGHLSSTWSLKSILSEILSSSCPWCQSPTDLSFIVALPCVTPFRHPPFRWTTCTQTRSQGQLVGEPRQRQIPPV